MEKFAILEPVRLYTNTTTVTKGFLNRGTLKVPIVHLIGRLPADIHLLVLSFLAIPDVSAYSRTCRILSELARDERVWEKKWKSLGIEDHRLTETLDELEKRIRNRDMPPTTGMDIVDDDFGDFASGSGGTNSSQTLFNAFQGISLSSHPSVLSGHAKPTFRQKFIQLHAIAKTLLPSLSSPPHMTLSMLFPQPAPSILQQSKVLHLLALYLSPAVRPVRNHENLYASLRTAIDRFQANLLSAFDVADGKHDEATMREVAYSSWEVWEGHLSSREIPVSEWETGRVWMEKKEIFYEQGKWKPLDNFTYVLHHFRISIFGEGESIGRMAC